MASPLKASSPDSPLFPLLCAVCWERVCAASPRVTLAVSRLCFSLSSEKHQALSLPLFQGFTIVHIALTLGRTSAEILLCPVTNLGQISSIKLQERIPRGLTLARCRFTFCSPDDLPVVHENFQLNPAQPVFQLTP